MEPGAARRGAVPLIDTPDDLHRGLEIYRDTFDTSYSAMLRDKLGLDRSTRRARIRLLVGVFGLLEAEETDMTIFFRGWRTCRSRTAASDERG